MAPTIPTSIPPSPRPSRTSQTRLDVYFVTYDQEDHDHYTRSLQGAQ